MAIVTLPRKQVNQRPRLGDQLDWTSPYADALALIVPCIELGSNSIQEYRTGSSVALTGATWNNNGVAIAAGAGNGGSFGAFSKYLPASTSITIYARASITWTGSVGGFISSQIAANPGGWIFDISATSGSILVANVGVGAATTTLTGLTSGTLYDIAWTAQSPTTTNLYARAVNGNGAIFTVSGSTPAPVSLGNIQLGTRPSSNSGSFTLQHMMMFTRAMSRADVMDLFANPYAMFRVPSLGRFGSGTIVTRRRQIAVWG
jgi:hypothetical protein